MSFDPDVAARIDAYAKTYAGLDLRMGPRTAPTDSEIDVTSVDNPHDLALAATNLVARQNHPESVFVRDGALARLRLERDGRAWLEDLAGRDRADQVMSTLARRINFYRHTKDGSRVNVTPPPDVCRSFRTLGEWPGIPVVDAVVETPVIRPDGTVNLTAGYDPLTRLYYSPTPDLENLELPSRPTQADAKAAAQHVIDELLVDFPFATQADQANALALMLTPLLRPATGLVPMAIITAPIKGSGKGLLAGLVASIATGRPGNVYAAPESTAELRKAIDAMLIEGRTYIWIDEPAQGLADPQLAAMLTAENYGARVLGSSQIRTGPQRATWVATGNNVVVGGDIDRRSYRIVLDPKTNRPWTRSGFRHPDLEAYARRNRPQYLQALLTMAVAWWKDGQPRGPQPTVGSFDTWARIVGGVLHHAGVEGFLGNLADHYADADSNATEWESFLQALRVATGGQHFTVAKITNLIEGHGDLRTLLPEDLEGKYGGAGFGRALGHALRSRRDTRHGTDELHLVACGKDSVSKRPRWRIVTGQEEEA